MELISRVTNPHDVGIDDTSQNDSRKVTDGKFQFYATSSPELLSNGIEVALEMDWNLETCKQELMNKLPIQDKDKKDLLIYLSRGIPFLGGTLNDYYSLSSNLKRFIYGIVVYKFTEEELKQTQTELCSLQTPLQKRIYAPFCDPSLINDKWTVGLCNMACLLGYLSHDGAKSDKLLRASASLIPFSPLLTCLKRVIDRNSPTNRDIITISATFHTYFKLLIRAEQKGRIVEDDQIFTYSLRCCNMITHIKHIREVIPMEEISRDKSDFKDAFVRLNQPETIYVFNGDIEKSMRFVSINSIMPRAIEDANKSFISFSPIAPLSIRLVNGCSIVRGREHPFLFLSQSMEKGAEGINKIDLIDPLKGAMPGTDLDEFAEEQGDSSSDDVSMLIDPDKIKQLVFVCFDRSSSMNGTIGHGWGHSSRYESMPRTVVATQYLTSFANKVYAYRIPCLLGLLVFNGDIEVRCELSPLIPDFEMIGLKDIEADGCTSLWDAIKTASDRLTNNKFRLGNNVIKRIIVISDGEDTSSRSETLESVAKNLLDNKIIVDAVFASSTCKCDELSALSHITGGVSIRPKNVNEGMSFFEKSAFLNIDERDMKTIPSKLKSSQIDKQFIRKAVKNAYYDEEVPNKNMSPEGGKPSITTPQFRCYQNRADKSLSTRDRRILRELHYAALVMDRRFPNYDPDVLVYPYEIDYRKWVLLMKASNDLYKSKWFRLSVTFPDEYPVEPPTIRFVTVPYHLNISKEGRICLEVLEKGYISSMHVIDIIQQIKVLFLIPSFETPIQIEVFKDFLRYRKGDNENVDDEEESDDDEESEEESEKGVEKRKPYRGYKERAKESADKLGKDKPDKFLSEFDLKPDKGVKFKLMYDDICDGEVPPYMRSQVSGRVIKNPILSSTGIIYEMNELMQLKANGQCCVVTGKAFTEKLEDFKSGKS